MTATLLPPPPPAPQEAPRRKASAKKGRLNKLIPLLLVLAGVFILLYPVAATQYNNVKQREFSQQYNQDVQHTDPIDLSADLESARAYNSTLSGVPILDPWLLKAATDPGSEPYKAYSSELDRFPVMARVRVPVADIDLPVYHGTTDEVIAKGAGHLYGTSLPVGGDSTHAVLTSHTGMADATLFDHLTKVQEGDMMFIDVLGETLAYKVDQIKIVLPNEISDLTTVAGHDYLTLFTCTPYAVNTHRLLVRGERVPFTPEMAEAAKPSPASVFKIEPWMYWLIGGAAFGLTALIIIVVRERRRNQVVAQPSSIKAPRGYGRRVAPSDLPGSPASPGRRFVDDP